MPQYSEASIKRLETCHPDLQTVFKEVIKYFDCTIICGHRGMEAQNKAYSESNSQLQFPASKHNKEPSQAVDVVPYPIDWSNSNRMRYFAGHVIGIARLLKEKGIIDNALRWGGDWNMNTKLNDNKFNDMAHFELI